MGSVRIVIGSIVPIIAPLVVTGLEIIVLVIRVRIRRVKLSEIVYIAFESIVMVTV